LLDIFLLVQKNYPGVIMLYFKSHQKMIKQAGKSVLLWLAFVSVFLGVTALFASKPVEAG